MLVTVIKSSGYDGHRQGSSFYVSEQEGYQLIQNGIVYDAAAFTQLTTQQQDAVYANAELVDTTPIQRLFDELNQELSIRASAQHANKTKK